MISDNFSSCLNAVHAGSAETSQDEASNIDDEARGATLKCLTDEGRRQKDAIKSDYEAILASGDAKAKEAVEIGQKEWSQSLVSNCQREVEREAKEMAAAGASEGVDGEINLQECMLNGLVSRRLTVQRLRDDAQHAGPSGGPSDTGETTSQEPELPQ
ncbi:hypothetical protein AA14337_3242 [Acetobacter malorum DSM 14337]|uniref:Lysozyme inhibitor LprI N-terminal domain-containing protein n=1 Tax=Acetobacter malorum DSM 14337 TaxID=1307910 RepID=A0ABQ0Q0G4_9PROT|nr:hypothetical protein AA14337_3242 [Acetobacter malorum DSM 14337]